MKLLQNFMIDSQEAKLRKTSFKAGFRFLKKTMSRSHLLILPVRGNHEIFMAVSDESSHSLTEVAVKIDQMFIVRNFLDSS